MAAEAATGSITYGTAAEAVAATGTLTLAANPTPGDTVTVGTKTYTFRTASASFVCKATADIGQGEYFDITFGGSTKRFWYDIDAAGTGAPADPGGGLNEIDIVTGNTDSQVATATELVVEAVTNLTSSASTNTVTVVYDLPGTLVVADSLGDVLGTITAIALAANEVLVGAAATDSIDNLISAITDGAGIGTGEGTLYGTGTTANVTATAAVGAGDTMTVTAITAGYDIGIVTSDTLTNVSSGFAAANLTGGLNRTAVIVNGTPFGYKATAPGANQFSSIAELNTLVTGRPLISSTSNGTVISIVADTPGVAGNAITLVREANTAGDLSVSGSVLAGGFDASTAPAEPTGGRLLPVVIVKNSANTVVATAILNALNTDAAFLATLATATLTITDAAPGARTAIAAGTSTFTGAARSGSTAAPVVWMKSFGTSQVVVAVAPN
jgi:hypothetical protein